MKNWQALTRFADDGDLEIDNNRTERSLRGWAIGRHNWTFFGSLRGGENGGDSAQLCGHVRTAQDRCVRLVSGCADEDFRSSAAKAR
jgi:hypothetical protein